MKGYIQVFLIGGTETDRGSRTAVYPSHKNEKGQYTRVFQAEVHAIPWEIDERFKDRRIAICSDNQPALMALYSITTNIVQELNSELNDFNSISRFKTVKLL